MTPSIVYDTPADWQRFTGSKRTSGGVLKLGHCNTATDLGLTGTVVNYRFAQTQNLQSAVGQFNDGALITMGSGVLEFTDDGVRTRGDASGANPDYSNFAAVRMGGPLADYTILQSATTPSPGVVTDTVVSFWAVLPSQGANGRIYGFNHHHQDSLVGGLSTNDFLYASGNILVYWSMQAESSVVKSYSAVYFYPSEYFDDKPHHVLLHVFWYQDADPGYLIRARMFIDGKWVGDDTQGYQHWPSATLGPMGSNTPTILAMSYVNSALPNSWGEFTATEPFDGVVDEFSLSHCNVAPGTGGTHQISPAWSPGQQILAIATRHPDPDQLGQDHSVFSIIGPVETITDADNSTISHVRAVTVGACGIFIFPVLGSHLDAWVVNYDFEFPYEYPYDHAVVVNRVDNTIATYVNQGLNLPCTPEPSRRDNGTQGLYLPSYTLKQKTPWYSSGTISLWAQRWYDGGNLACFRDGGTGDSGVTDTPGSALPSPTIYLSDSGHPNQYYVHATLYDSTYGVYRTLTFAQDFGINWRMITLTWAPVIGASLYVDGVLRDSIAMATPGLPFTNLANVTLWLGGSHVACGSRFLGSVDEFVYLRIALCQDGINELLAGATYATAQSHSTQTGSASKVQVAVRASTTTFAADDQAMPWSNWYDVTSSLAFPVGCAGAGRYVQAKVRIYPSDDVQRLYSPGIDRLELIEPQNWDGNYTTDFSEGIPPWLFPDNPTYWTIDNGMLKLTPVSGVPQIALVDPNNGGVVASMIAGVYPNNSGFFLVFGYRSHSDFYFAGEMVDPADGILKWAIGHYGGPSSVVMYAKRTIFAWTGGMQFKLDFGYPYTNLVDNIILVMGGDYGLDHTFPDLSQIASLPVGVGGINANFSLSDLTVIYKQRTHGDGNADCNARIVVTANANLTARISVFCRGEEGCEARIGVFFRGIPSDLGARLQVKDSSHFEGRLRVREFSTLDATIDVNVLFSSEILPAWIWVVRHDRDQAASITVTQPQQHSTLEARINVPIHTLPSRITVFRRDSIPLSAMISVTPQLPGPVRNLKASMPENIWQLNGKVKFTWDNAIPKVTPILGYYYYFGSEPSPRPSTEWTFTDQLHLDTNLRDSGKSYFTIAAIDTNGLFGPTRTCGVWLNHPPTVPGVRFMKINGYSTTDDAIRFIARYPNPYHVLTWDPSTDADAEDIPNLTYEIEIASRDDFDLIPQTSTSSVSQVHSNIVGTTFNWANLPGSGLWFWRIRASDGKQFSNWSRCGWFIVNTPPLQPTELCVRQR